MTNAQPFDPHEFLLLAARLTQSANEGDLRSAVSRAYYAVFLRAREVLRARGVIVPANTGRDHAVVMRALRANDRRAGSALNRLRLLRGRVDYDLHASISQAHALQVVALAQWLWTRL